MFGCSGRRKKLSSFWDAKSCPVVSCLFCTNKNGEDKMRRAKYEIGTPRSGYPGFLNFQFVHFFEFLFFVARLSEGLNFLNQ